MNELGNSLRMAETFLKSELATENGREKTFEKFAEKYIGRKDISQKSGRY